MRWRVTNEGVGARVSLDLSHIAGTNRFFARAFTSYAEKGGIS